MNHKTILCVIMHSLHEIEGRVTKKISSQTERIEFM